MIWKEERKKEAPRLSYLGHRHCYVSEVRGPFPLGVTQGLGTRSIFMHMLHTERGFLELISVNDKIIF